MHSNSRIGVLWSGFRSFASIRFAEIKYAGGAGPGLGRRVGANLLQLFWCTRTQSSFPSRSRYFLRDLREDFGEACWSVRPGGVTSQSVYVSAAPGIQVGGVDFERMWLTRIALILDQFYNSTLSFEFEPPFCNSNSRFWHRFDAFKMNAK